MKLIKLHTRVGRLDGEVIAAHAQVDDDDAEDLERFTWYYKKDNPGTPGEHISVGRDLLPDEEKRSGLLQELMNRRILRLPKGAPQVRFVDGDTLNNQKANLYIMVDGRRLSGTTLRELYSYYKVWKVYQSLERELQRKMF
jgi:hypothetical protein